ncbi:hypothetical protein TNCV_560631 [Trichonephila clavipes]|nr:hypothetical protein TNCV_560631 [Trichonephila clavipes]
MNASKERKGPPKTVRTPENVEQDYVSIQTGMIQQFFLPALQERDLDSEWLQKDGETALDSRVSTGVLRATFPE